MKTITLALVMVVNSFGIAPINRTKKAEPGRQTVTGQQKPETMEKGAAKVVSDFLTAVQKGDNATVAASLHPNIEWNQPGNNRFSGAKKSSTEVFQMVGGMLEVSAHTLELTDVKVTAVNGNTVACLVHWKAVKPTGLVLDVDNIDVYTVENEQIVSAKVYSADITQEDDFWQK
ncbi:nuclear transport factor 2 family protein [Larkinella terrae]|nr:nuclear transport factor 2 family protein [Larkinella terrae]